MTYKPCPQCGDLATLSPWGSPPGWVCKPCGWRHDLSVSEWVSAAKERVARQAIELQALNGERIRQKEDKR